MQNMVIAFGNTVWRRLGLFTSKILSQATWFSIAFRCGSSFDLWFVSLGAIASSDHCSFDCDPFECPSSCPDLLAYTVSLKLQVYFALSYRNSLKLSLIGIFMSLAAVAKVLLGTVLLVAIGYYMPALLFFVGIGMWHFFISDMLEPVYEIIHEKLATK